MVKLCNPFNSLQENMVQLSENNFSDESYSPIKQSLTEMQNPL